MLASTLARALTEDYYTNQIFDGIYSRDEIPILKDKKAIIVNLDTKNQPGSHWLVISLCRANFVDYLCSFQSDPSQYSLIWTRLCETNRILYQFPRLLQSRNYITNCGSWCLLNFYFVSRGFTPPEIISYYFPPSVHLSSPSSSSTDREAFKNDLFVSYTIPHLLPYLKRFSPESLLIDVSFLKKNQKNHATS